MHASWGFRVMCRRTGVPTRAGARAVGGVVRGGARLPPPPPIGWNITRCLGGCHLGEWRERPPRNPVLGGSTRGGGGVSRRMAMEGHGDCLPARSCHPADPPAHHQFTPPPQGAIQCFVLACIGGTGRPSSVACSCATARANWRAFTAAGSAQWCWCKGRTGTAAATPFVHAPR